MGKGNEPAYPDGSTNEWGNANSRGLTKREYFAGLAMQGMIAYGEDDLKRVAASSVSYADALLAALERSHDGG